MTLRSTRRPARTEIALQRRERELGNGVARLRQRLEQTDLGRNGTRVQRPPKAGPPKSLGIDVQNRLEIFGLLSPDDHRLILASPVFSRP